MRYSWAGFARNWRFVVLGLVLLLALTIYVRSHGAPRHCPPGLHVVMDKDQVGLEHCVPQNVVTSR